MAYSVTQKKEERSGDRSVEVNGETFAPRPLTIAVDQELFPLRQAEQEAIDVHDKIVDELYATGDDGEYTATVAERRKLAKKLKDAEAAVIDARMQQIVARLQPSSAGSSLTVADLKQHLEVEDITPILQHLVGKGEKTLGGPGPTSPATSE